ncbi:MAG: hypothetical protein J0626_12290 [Rhodospirillaceae bacterium]|nr:hypothetical protein [Rhodospirillaceae bacterium]
MSAASAFCAARPRSCRLPSSKPAITSKGKATTIQPSQPMMRTSATTL